MFTTKALHDTQFKNTLRCWRCSLLIQSLSLTALFVFALTTPSLALSLASPCPPSLSISVCRFDLGFNKRLSLLEMKTNNNHNAIVCSSSFFVCHRNFVNWIMSPTYVLNHLWLGKKSANAFNSLVFLPKRIYTHTDAEWNRCHAQICGKLLVASHIKHHRIWKKL